MKSWIEIGSNYLHDSQVFLVLLDAGIKSFVVMAVAAGLCRRRASAATRHWVWFLGVASLLALPWLSFIVPAWTRPVWSVSADLESGNRMTLAIGLTPTQASGSSMRTQSTPALNAASPGARAAGQVLRVSAQLNANWLAAATVFWLVGSAVVLATAAAGHLQLWRIRRRARTCRSPEWVGLLQELCGEMGIRRPVSLAQAGDNVIPMTWGWLRPVILVPAQADQWPEEKRRVVLWHELAHVQRWDYLTQMIATLAGALYWFNPLVWLAAKRMRAERELACDDLVLNGGWKASDYAGHLVEMAGTLRRLPRVAAIAMARSSGLQGRVLAILDGQRNHSRMATLPALLLAIGIVSFGLFLGGCTTTQHRPETWSIEKSEVGDQLKRFVAEKEMQAVAGAKAEGKEMVPEYQSMFAAAAKGDWLNISNTWETLRQRAPQYEGSSPRDLRLHGTAWQTMLEIWGAFGNIVMGGEKLVALGKGAVDSIPAGSIYFGGTDPGRCVITALQKSQVHGDPFFTLTQNALADNSYLQYLRGMYGDHIYLPTDADSQKCFADYVADAQRRLKEKRLRPGEDVQIVEGKPQVSGQVAVMAINALLAKMIFDQNPGREFYVEESFPLDWMYPHLTPNGPILKINRRPIAEMSEEIVRRDHEYWTRTLQPMIGSWLDYKTPLKRVAAFAATAQPPKEDAYVHNDAARKWGSKLRSAIAGVYVWRMQNAGVDGFGPTHVGGIATAYTTRNNPEKQRMMKEADFAFRQAFALCPYSPEAVFRYVNFLAGQKRFEDAALVAGTAWKLVPENRGFHELVKQLERMKSSTKT